MSQHTLTPEQAAAVQTACAMLVAAYAHASDARDHEAFAETFAPDAQWIRLGGQHVMRGRKEIINFMNSRGPGITRHVCGSIHIQPLDANRATGHSYTTLYRDAGYAGTCAAQLSQPEAVVDYLDEFVRIDGRWYFERREARYIFAAEAAKIHKPVVS